MVVQLLGRDNRSGLTELVSFEEEAHEEEMERIGLVLHTGLGDERCVNLELIVISPQLQASDGSLRNCMKGNVWKLRVNRRNGVRCAGHACDGTSRSG